MNSSEPQLKAEAGELRMRLQITRAGTGKVEEYSLVGNATAEQAQELGLEPTQE